MAHSGPQHFQQHYQYPYPQQYQQAPQQYYQLPQYQQPSQGQQYNQSPQYQQQPQFGYNNHQQYPQQGYQQHYGQGYLQQPSPQHSGPAHNRGYPHQSLVLQGPPAQAAPETCYNCGLPDHFAQDCPEPRREVPAGYLKRQKRQHNFKPQYIDSGINTNMQPPQGYHSSTPPQHGYSQHQQAYSPVTPQSAQSTTSNQWRRQNLWYQNQQSYQQNQQSLLHGQHQSQPSSYQPQSIATPTTPATGFQSGPQQPTQGSPTASYHYSTAQAPQIPYVDQMSLQQHTKGSVSDPPSSGAQANGEPDKVDEEAEEDDLNSLDVPDLPQSTRFFGETVISRIGRPMPANFIVADALWPIQPPSAESEGKCQSKYFSDKGRLQSITDSPYWKDHEDDTIFLEIPDTGEIISIADCRFKIKERQKHPVDSEVQRKSRSQSRSVAPRSAEAAEMAESLETLERALAEAKAKQAEMIRNRKRPKQRQHSDIKEEKQQQTFEEVTKIKLEHQSPPQEAISEQPARHPQGTEDILASLGVTGTPKPVTNSSRMVSQASPSADAAIHRSRSSSKEISNTNPYLSPYEQQPSHYQANGMAQGTPQYGHTQHPPPPPPPIRTPSHSNTIAQSPDPGDMDPYGYSTNGADIDNGYYTYGTDGQAASPNQYRTDGSFSRKRSYDQRESSSEESDSSRRQEDDITPKRKKRQPKVAAAYSRRW